MREEPPPRPARGRDLSALRSIAAHCWECTGNRFDGDRRVRQRGADKPATCTVTDCWLYQYRMGTSPNHKGRTMSEEQRQAAGERMRAYNAAQKAHSQPLSR
jgi:hypothetical protein